MKEPWLDDIEHHMADFEAEEPANLWESIETRLPHEDERKPLTLPWWRHRYVQAAAAVALLTLVVSVGVFLPQQNRTAQSKPTAHATARPVPEPTPNQPESLLADAASVSAPISHPVPNVPARDRQRPEENPAPITIDTTLSAGTNVAAESSALRTEADTVPPRRPNIDRLIPNDTPLLADNQESTPSKTSQKHTAIALAAYMSGGLNASSATQRDAAMLTAVGTDGVSWEDDPMLGILLYNQGLPTHIRYTHYMPIRAGVSVAFRFHKRLAMETGVVYSCLLSDYEDGSDSHYMAGRQTLHYIGVPLNLTCDIYSWRMLSVYGSVGGMAEYCVGGTRRTDYVLNAKREQTSTERISEHPWQFSATLAAGVQYNCLPWLGLYLEPGATYRFRDNSTLQSIYKQRPFNFSLSLGLRFAI